MKPYVYQFIHIVGIMMVFMSFGAAILHNTNGGTRKSNAGKGLVAATHGLGLLLILVSGGGLAAVKQTGFPFWVIAKVAIWLALAALIVPIGRNAKGGKIFWFLVPLLGIIAAYLGIFHNFVF